MSLDIFLTALSQVANREYSGAPCTRALGRSPIAKFILLHAKFLQFYWLRAVVFQLNLKYLHVKITNLLRVVV